MKFGTDTEKVVYTYDELGRMATRKQYNGSSSTVRNSATYSYLAGSQSASGYTSCTPLVSGINQTGVDFSYGYDAKTANIVRETRSGGTYGGETTYAYDSMGQLVRVNDPVENATWVYTYDLGGNILNKKKYAYTTGTVGTVQQTISYTYGDTNWKDKLTKYNGVTLTYDNMGNVTNDGTWTYAWAAGRQLSGMSKSGTSIEFDYDHNGLRVKKKVGNTETNYTLNGKLVVHLTKGSDWMHFYYDAQGRPAMVNFNGTKYHYLYNLQGDIVGIVDASGNIVVEYKYDAWGKIIGRTGSLVSTLGYLNPFRYRGYVYDEETGLYYLRSRYYNPEWGRFINADILLGKRGALLSHNLFAYCCNNAIVCLDPTGRVKSYVFYYYFPESSSPLHEEAMNAPYFDSTNDFNVEMIPVASSEDFINAWNSMEGPIVDVFLYLHGEAGQFSMDYDKIYVDPTATYSVEDLEKKSIIGTIYNFACHGADESAGKSMASALAERMEVPVIACDVGVSYRYGNGLELIFGENWYARSESLALGCHWYKYTFDKSSKVVNRLNLATNMIR